VVIWGKSWLSGPVRVTTVEVVRVTGIDHVVFNVSDAERSLAWWRDLLGLEPVRLEAWRRGEVPFVSVRISPSTILDLFVTERSGENVDHVALRVDGADLDELAESGRFDVVRGPMDVFGAEGQGHGLYVRDPDGNVIELRTYP
jgi:catechol 2,3-dioxygenase-like lactoylglutathione lyase family enzyme